MANRQAGTKRRDAIRRIRSFHAIGFKSLARKPGRMEYGAMREEAARFQVSEEMLRKARQFADPDHGYSKEEVTAIIHSWKGAAAPRRRQDGQDEFVLGTTHFIRWLTIPKRKRARIEQQTIAEGWSLTRLEAEISAQFGARKFGGRRRRIPTDAIGILVQLASLCDEWRRWHESLTRDPDEDEKKGTAKHLPEEILRRLQLLAKEMGELQVLVASQIQTQKPKRGARRSEG